MIQYIQMKSGILLLGIAALILASSVAYYLLVYTPQIREEKLLLQQQQEIFEINQKAAIECQKLSIKYSDEVIKAPIYSAQDRELADNLLVRFKSSEWIEACKVKLLSEWGY